MTILDETQDSERYGRVAAALHWVIAALIAFNFLFGYFMTGLPGDLRRYMLNAHFSSGLIVLGLTCVRILWRVIHAPPSEARWTRKWERTLAHLVHFLLYAAMVVMPLTGWVIVSTNPPLNSSGRVYADAQAAATVQRGAPAPEQKKERSRFLGVLPMPRIDFLREIGATPGGVAPQKVLQKHFEHYHYVLGFVLLGLLFLHIAGALKHQVIGGHPQLARMRLSRKRALRTHGSARQASPLSPSPTATPAGSVLAATRANAPLGRPEAPQRTG